MPEKLKIFSGTSNRPLAQKIADYVKCELGDLQIRKFSDGEIWVKFGENIRGMDVFIIQSTNPPGDNILELLLSIDAARRASAKRITAVIPYYGYGRQDRKDQPRVPISARLMMNIIATAGANRILAMDLHSTQIQGFVDIPFDHLYAKGVLLDYLKKTMDLENLVVVAPDVGAIKMARSYAKYLGVELAIFDKRRPGPNRAEVLNLIGNVRNKDVVFIDDLVDTAGTLSAAAEKAMQEKARKIFTAITHPVLSGNAVEKLKNSPISRIIVTDTLALPEEKMFEKLEIRSVAPIFGEAILRIHNEESISSLFEYDS